MRRQNTQYTNEADNWGCMCIMCQEMADEYWDERWQEYYAGIM